MNTPKPAKWSAAENSALVAFYFEMLAKHNAGTPFNKAAGRRLLMAPGAPLAARSNGSVEMKLMNVSGCMRALGRLPLKGYQPAMNYQSELMTAVCRHLGIGADQSHVSAA